MVAHDEVVRVLDDFRTVVLVAAELWRHEQVRLKHFVDEDPAIFNAYRVAFLGHDPLDERLVGVAWVIQHHDVALLRHSEEPVGGLVDDQSVLVLKSRLHAFALDTGDLEPECHDERGIHGGRCEGLEPGEELLTRA